MFPIFIAFFLSWVKGGWGGNDLEWIKDDGFPSRKVLWYAWSIFIHVDSCFELDI